MQDSPLHIYLDNSATTRPLPAVTEAVLSAMHLHFGNPASPHILGMEAERQIDAARQNVAQYFGLKSHEIYFTSGATEANNTLIQGLALQYQGRGRHLITSTAEHPSVQASFEYLESLGFHVDYLPVNSHAQVKIDDLLAALRPDTIVVSIVTANNEVGTLQPLRSIRAALDRLHPPRPILHSDVVQAVANVPITYYAPFIDALSVSAHKLGGPKGVGAFSLRSGLSLIPLLRGGGQERNLRSGTPNTPGIVGFGVALQWLKEYQVTVLDEMARLRDLLIKGMEHYIPHVKINGFGYPTDREKVAPHIVNAAFLGVPAEVLVHAAAEAGLIISTGTACSSRKEIVSPTLEAMGLNRETLQSSVRISLSPHTTEDEVNRTIQILTKLVADLRKVTGTPFGRED